VSTRRRVTRRLAATALLVTVLMVGGAGPALAHSDLERSDPPIGGSVAVGRTSLTLWFSEPVDRRVAEFGLRTAAGENVEMSAAIAAGDQAVVRIDTDPLAEGTYLLDWSILSSEDGHPSRGTVVFGVGAAPSGTFADQAGAPPTASVLLRWLELSALITAVGGIAVSGRTIGAIGRAGEAGVQRSRWAAAMAPAVAAVAGVLLVFVRVPHQGLSPGAWIDASLAVVGGAPWGRLWIGRQVALVLAAIVLTRRAVHRSEIPGSIPAAGAALLVAVGLEGWLGHASTLPGRRAVAAVVSAAHLASAGVWVGGLFVLAVCLFPMVRRNPDLRGPVLASVWKKFSPMAAVAAGILVATGFYESGRHLPDLAGVGDTLYGKAVAAKVGLVLLALVLAGFNTLLVNPRLAAVVGRRLGREEGWAPVSLRRFAVVAGGEILVLVLAAGGAAVLTSVPTGREIAATAAPTAPAHANVDGLFITFEAVPVGADESMLFVRTRSTVKPERGPITDVQVVAGDPSGDSTRLGLVPVEPGRYQAEAGVLTAPGEWDVAVVVVRRGVEDAVASFRWFVPPPAADVVSPFEMAATVALVLVLMMTAGLVVVARRRRPVPAVPYQLVEEGSGRP
jgi:copper transport protein